MARKTKTFKCPDPPKQKTASQAVKRMEKGNARYIRDELEHCLQDVDRRVLTANCGQQPWAVVLTCADSRVTPEMIFDTGIGELFVIRVAGNIANTSSLASVEYAVKYLKVNLVVVLGHEQCGAVQAAMDSGTDYGHNLHHLLAHIKLALNPPPKKSKDQVTASVEQNARYAADELLLRSSILQDAGRKLRILPAIYRLKTGEVDFLRT